MTQYRTPFPHINKTGALALGTFDGVHIGHKAVIERAAAAARSNGAPACVWCFSDPPRPVRPLTSADEKARLIEAILTAAILTEAILNGAHANGARPREANSAEQSPAGSYPTESHPREAYPADPSPTEPPLTEILTASALIMPSPTRELLAMTPEEFLDRLITATNPLAVVVGFNFTYGKGAAGNVETLRATLAAKNIPLTVVAPVEYNGVPVSSTLIRRLTAANDPAAARLLGR